MAQDESNGAAEARETLYFVGGVTLLVLGAGLILAHPAVRKSLTAGLSAFVPELKGRLLPDFSALGSDMQRYMKLRSM